MSKVIAYPDKRPLSSGAPDSARLENGGGNGHDGGMDDVMRRINALETDMRDVKSILTRMEPVLARIDLTGQKGALDVAELKGRVSQLPSTIQLAGFILAVLVAGGVLKYFIP